MELGLESFDEGDLRIRFFSAFPLCDKELTLSEEKVSLIYWFYDIFLQ